MDSHDHHEQLIQSIAKEYQAILTNSEQGIYIYLDDKHKICNKKFADLLGYQSENAWAKIHSSFPDVFVAQESQETLITAFQDAIEKMNASTNKIVWKKKDGNTLETTVLLVPIVYQGHLLALHFVSAV
jgi:PAS domain S-box-containing protein